MSKAEAKIAVVIPAYNESGTIADIAMRAYRHCRWVIVVDDGSDDATGEILAKLPVTLLRNDRNQGKAACLVRGAQHALSGQADAVITLDGDGQHRPEDIPRFLAEARRAPGRLVIGTRLAQREHAPFMRLLANRFADFWISWAAGFPIRDTQSGFRLYPAEVLRRVRISPTRNGRFVYESAFLIEAARQLQNYITSVGIDSIYRPGARASHYRPFTDTARIVLMVSWKLISWGGYPLGLLRSLGILAPRQTPGKTHRGPRNFGEIAVIENPKDAP